ncbi:RNA-binding protein 25, partial [Ophiophagus hannah]
MVMVGAGACGLDASHDGHTYVWFSEGAKPQNAMCVHPRTCTPPPRMHVHPRACAHALHMHPVPMHVQQRPKDQLAGGKHALMCGGVELGQWLVCPQRGLCVPLWHACHRKEGRKERQREREGEGEREEERKKTEKEGMRMKGRKEGERERERQRTEKERDREKAGMRNK